MSDPKGFLKHARQTPERRPVTDRLKDYKEFYLPAEPTMLSTQGSRCMDCGVPFCHGPQGCPVENYIPEWNDLVHQGRWKEALKALHATNNFPEFTGRLCPAPCESACVLGINSDPVAIRVIEWNIIDRAFEEGWVQPILARRRSGKKVAVIGSGPAGLAAAQQLQRAGHEVTVLEKADRIGGLLRYGIPDFKMEKSVLDRRLAQLKAEGIEFRTGVHVGGPGGPALADLRAQYAAVCLAIGAEQARELAVPGRELGGVHLAMDYLMEQNRACSGGPAPEISARGKNVVIIGGGDTGSDCLGTALRQGARSVHQFEILPRPPETRAAATPWPHWPLQLRTSHAHEEGGIRDWCVATASFSGQGGQVRKLHGQRVEWRGAGPAPVAGSDFELDAELVLLAMGFTGPVRAGLVESMGLKLDARGAIAVDASYMTSERGIFAAGDAKRGASLIVWAISEGRKMAEAVDRYLAR